MDGHRGHFDGDKAPTTGLEPANRPEGQATTAARRDCLPIHGGWRSTHWLDSARRGRTRQPRKHRTLSEEHTSWLAIASSSSSFACCSFSPARPSRVAHSLPSVTRPSLRPTAWCAPFRPPSVSSRPWRSASRALRAGSRRATPSRPPGAWRARPGPMALALTSPRRRRPSRSPRTPVARAARSATTSRARPNPLRVAWNSPSGHGVGAS